MLCEWFKVVFTAFRKCFSSQQKLITPPKYCLGAAAVTHSAAA